MQDRISENPGRVLITPENGGSAYYATMARADNPTQKGTPLNKSSLLRDITAALVGLDAEAVPDDVFAFFGKYNQHWWQRRTNIENGGYVAKEQTYSYGATFFVTDKQAATIMAAEAYTCDFTTGEITLVNPVTISTTTGSLTTAQINSLKGKYCTGLYSVPDKIVYLASDMEIQTGTNYVRLNDGYNTEVVSVFTSDKLIGEWVYLRSSERTAYPDSGIVDGYEFQYLGIPFQNAVTAPKIETGSYTGTGKYGSSNKNSLMFDFKPKIWGIYAHDTPNSNQIVFTTGMILPFESLSPNYGVSVHPNGPTSTSGFWTISVSGNTVSWWVSVNGEQNAYTQANTSGDTYYYFAIG